MERCGLTKVSVNSPDIDQTLRRQLKLKLLRKREIALNKAISLFISKSVTVESGKGVVAAPGISPIITQKQKLSFRNREIKSRRGITEPIVAG